MASQHSYANGFPTAIEAVAVIRSNLVSASTGQAADRGPAKRTGPYRLETACGADLKIVSFAFIF